MSGKLVVHDIHVVYPKQSQRHPAVDGVSLTLEPGEMGCLLGASGSGKTTVLRAIAGLEPVLKGVITIDDQVMTSSTVNIPPEKRHVGMMFQDYALFPHLDVSANIGFGLRQLSRSERRARVDELLDLVGLTEFIDRYPHELSGGQQQRVALARALAPNPDILLLDEPFSNLDVDTREHLASELRQILKQTKHTALMVTHHIEEAYAMADQIGLMSQGKLSHWLPTPDMQARLGEAKSSL